MLGVEKAIISKLLSDSAVQSALGYTGDNRGSVLEVQGYSTAKMRYPHIAVGDSTEVPTVASQGIQQLEDIAGKRPGDVFVAIHVFSKDSTSNRAKTIEQRVRESLEGMRTATEEAVLHSVELESTISEGRDPDTDIWHLVSRYHIVAHVI